MQFLRAEIDDVGMVRRNHNRRDPVISERRLPRFRSGTDAPVSPGFLIETVTDSELKRRINRIAAFAWIDCDRAPVAPANQRPVTRIVGAWQVRIRPLHRAV